MSSHVGADPKCSSSGSCFSHPETAVWGFKPRQQGRDLCPSSSFQPVSRGFLSRPLPPNPAAVSSLPHPPWMCQSFLEVTPISAWAGKVSRGTHLVLRFPWPGAAVLRGHNTHWDKKSWGHSRQPESAWCNLSTPWVPALLYWRAIKGQQ